MVNAFTYDEAAIASLRAAFSDARLGTYVAMAGGDYAAACCLHERNTALSAALYGAIQTLELAMRNRIAHHEPIIGRDLQADYPSILVLLGWIDPQVAGWHHHHSRFADVFSGGDATLRF